MAKTIQETPLWLDVEDIFNKPEPIPTYNYQGQLHTVDQDIDAINITSIDIGRDYINNIGDEIIVKFHVYRGDYILDIYPKRHNLEFTIKRMLITNSEYPDTSKGFEIERYKAVFLVDGNLNAQTSKEQVIDRHTLNNQEPVEMVLQLLNRSLEPLRMKTVRGVFKDIKREDFIRSILAGETEKILIDGKPGLDSFNIVKPDNSELIKQLILPDNTPVLTVPTYLQERHTGVYATGIGNYFQTYDDQRTWFVYPLYNVERFRESVPKIIIYSIPEFQFSAVDRTFNIRDTCVHVLGTGSKRYQDDGETEMMNSGVGFRQANADSMMDKPIDMQADGPVGNNKKVNTEVTIKKREDGFNHAPTSTRGIAVNSFAEYSRQASKNLAKVDIVWHNSKPELLYPGMPCKYVYVDGEEIKEVKGVVVYNHTFISHGNPQSGLKFTDQKYSMSTALRLVVEKFIDVIE